MDKQVKMNKGAVIEDSFFITQSVLYIEDLRFVGCHMWGWQCFIIAFALRRRSRQLENLVEIDFPEGFCPVCTCTF